MGEVEYVSGMAKKTFSERTIKNGYREGELMTVEIPTWINSILRFKNGAQASLFTSFDCFFDRESRIELYGTDGTILVTDPNWFNGDIKIFNKEINSFENSPLIGPDIQNLRGIGISEMAVAIDEGRPCAASVDRALHIMAIIEAIETSIEEGRVVKVQ